MQERGPATLRPAGCSVDPGGPGGRLAELVAHLTGCAPTAAVDAVVDAVAGAIGSAEELDLDDRLDVVARALVRVKRSQPFDLRERDSA